MHDLGALAVDSTGYVRVGLWNFCGDSVSEVIGTVVRESTAGLDVRVDGPPEGPLFAGLEELEIWLTPRVAGPHSVTVRLTISHGYYDFTVLLEAE